MRRLGAFLRLPLPQKALALEAALYLGRASVAVRRVPMRLWRGGPDAGITDARPPAGGAAAGRAVGHMVGRVARRLPFEAACLPQALAARWMLRRRDVASRLVFGVRRAADGSRHYHAWLTVNGETVVGGRGAGRFTPLFAAGPAARRHAPRARADAAVASGGSASFPPAPCSDGRRSWFPTSRPAGSKPKPKGGC